MLRLLRFVPQAVAGRIEMGRPFSNPGTVRLHRLLVVLLPILLTVPPGCDNHSWRSPVEPGGPSCLDRAVFPDPADSPYVLPYPVGAAYELFQTYCGPLSHGRDLQLAYDFHMPIGSELVAARNGVVVNVVDEFEEFGSSLRLNRVDIQHDDGTAAFYAHLMQGGASVELGDRVSRGRPIGFSGSSGTSIPHLHFGVYRTWPWRDGGDLPVSFRNLGGPLDDRGGLIAGEVYQALSY
jgi:hypothetical protein